MDAINSSASLQADLAFGIGLFLGCCVGVLLASMICTTLFDRKDGSQ